MDAIERRMDLPYIREKFVLPFTSYLSLTAWYLHAILTKWKEWPRRVCERCGQEAALSLFFDVSTRKEVRGAILRALSQVPVDVLVTESDSNTSRNSCRIQCTYIVLAYLNKGIRSKGRESRSNISHRANIAMQLRRLAHWLFLLLSTGGSAYAGIGNGNACSGPLERALDALHRDTVKRNKLDEKEAGTSYQRELTSAPFEMSVSRMAVKLPENTKESGGHWARVEQCMYEPSRHALRTRVVFNDLSVSGIVSLTPRDHHVLNLAESCRMTLRLRRAGIDFLTSPIARGRGQMRIRTESSFLEPRFASIYAYGCHPTRFDKQIKRQDKWPPRYSASEKVTPTFSLLLGAANKYDAAEPRQLAGGITEEIDVVIPNESRHPRYSHAPETSFGIWRKNSWITKSARQRRSTIRRRFARAATVVTPRDLADALEKEREESPEKSLNASASLGSTGSLPNEEPPRNVSREVRELAVDDNLFPIDLEDPNKGWQSKEHITREMEDVFLQGASQALTKYIERQLHPAIKEVLMLSMGYTISYG